MLKKITLWILVMVVLAGVLVVASLKIFLAG